MEPKRICELTTANAVREASDDTLDDLCNRASGYLSHSDPSIVRYMQNSIQAIRSEQTHRRSKNDANQNTSNDWYKKPVGIILLSVTGGVLLIIIKLLLGI